MKRVLVLQHADAEHLGRIADALAAAEIEHTCVRVYLHDPIPPRLNGYNGLIIMGGPQSVYDELRFPFFAAEKQLVRDAIKWGRPVLAVCLGSQVLAEVIGARVRAGLIFELGWRKVSLLPETKDDPVLAILPPVIHPFHWHGDVYDLPPESKPIGFSDLTPVQGFVWNKKFYAFLFHLEMKFPQIAAMLSSFPNDVHRAKANAEVILADAAERVAALEAPSMEVFRRWAMLL